MVHTKLFILSLRRMGMADAEQKTVVGDPLGSLGFEVRIRGCRIRCTEAKRVVMLDDIERQLGWATADLMVRCKPGGGMGQGFGDGRGGVGYGIDGP